MALTSGVCLDRAKAAAERGVPADAVRWACTVTDVSEELVDWMAATSLLRRALPAAGAGTLPRRARVAVLGSYTTRQLVQILPLAAARCGIDVELHEGGYDQFRQEILDPRGELARFRPDVVVLAVHEGALALPEVSSTRTTTSPGRWRAGPPCGRRSRTRRAPVSSSTPSPCRRTCRCGTWRRAPPGHGTP